MASGPQGKKRAARVQYPVQAGERARRRVEATARWTWPRRLAMPLFGGLWWYTAQRWGVNPWAWALYGLMSLAAFVAYTRDKWAAEDQRFRVPESTLLLLGLAGGWPGALLAQQAMRHKTSKSAFVEAFWVSVLLNAAGFAGWHARVQPLLDGLLG